MEELGNQDSDLEDLPPLDDMPFSLDDEPLDLGDIDLEDEGAAAGGDIGGDFSDSEGAMELDLDMSEMPEMGELDAEVGDSADFEADGDFSVLEDPDASEIDASDLDASDVAVPSGDEETPPVDLETTDSAPDEAAGAEGVAPSFFDEDEDETVALSEDELEDILGNTDEGFFEDFGEGSDADETPATADEDALEMRSDADLVPDVDLEPIAPGADSDDAFSDAESLELPPEEELGFDDFHDGDSDVPAVSADALDDDALVDDDSADEFSAGILEGDDDEPIALSEDELDNIMGDVSPGTGEMLETPGPEDDDDVLEDFGPVDDLDTDVDPFEDSGSESAVDGMPEDEDDENITLSDDELSQVLLDADGEDNAAADVPENLDDEDGAGLVSYEDEDDVPDSPSLSTLDMEDDEPIALTPEELGNIVSEVEGDEVVESDGMELGEDDYAMAGVDDDDFGDFETGTDDTFEADDDFGAADDDFAAADDGEDFSADDDEAYSADALGGDDDGDVALSDSELGSILEDTDTDSATTAEGVAPPDDFDDFDDFEDAGDFADSGDAGDVDEAAAVAGVVPSDDEFADGKVIVLDEYEDQGGDEPVVEGPPEIEEDAAAVAPAAAASEGLAARAERIADEENLNREELRTMISYLDGLFDQLPEDTVREFSRSQYFDLYKKIMGELGL